MSKITIYTMMAAVLLIVIAVAFNLPVVAGTAGLLMLIGIGYAYVVAKREFDGTTFTGPDEQ